jgi:hypothetical protein
LHRELPQDHVGFGARAAAQPCVGDRLLEEPVGCLRPAEMAFSLRRLSVCLGERGGVAETLERRQLVFERPQSSRRV